MLSLPAPAPVPHAAAAPRVRRIGNAWLLLASQVLVTLGPAATRSPGFTVHMDHEGFIYAVPPEGAAPAAAREIARIGAEASVLDLARDLATAMRTPSRVLTVDED